MPFSYFPVEEAEYPFKDNSSQAVFNILSSDTFNPQQLAKYIEIDEDSVANIATAHASGLSRDQIFGIMEDAQMDMRQYSGWLLFLDELPNADVSVQQAAYKLVLDRQVATHSLHEDCHIMVAGNREEDNSFVNPMPEALKSRLIHISVNPSVDEWADWAYEAELDPRVISFIKFAPERLLRTVQDTDQETSACPRTWHFLSKLMGSYPNVAALDDKALPIFHQLVYGTVGQADGHYFLEYVNYFSKLPTMQDLLANAETIAFPEEMGIQFATCAMLMSHVNKSNFEQALKYIMRLPQIELKIMTLKGIFKRNRADQLYGTPAGKKVLSELGDYLFA